MECSNHCRLRLKKVENHWYKVYMFFFFFFFWAKNRYRLLVIKDWKLICGSYSHFQFKLKSWCQSIQLPVLCRLRLFIDTRLLLLMCNQSDSVVGMPLRPQTDSGDHRQTRKVVSCAGKSHKLLHTGRSGFVFFLPSALTSTHKFVFSQFFR